LARGFAIRQHRHGEHVHAALGHRFELAAQRHRLRPRLPGVHHAILRGGVTLDLLEHEIDAGRDDQPVVRQRRAARQSHLAPVRLDGYRAVPDDAHAPLSQAVIAARDIAH
jgi:hypothetical protein